MGKNNRRKQQLRTIPIAAKKGQSKIITLVMIVKNESKIITRLLNSCLKVVNNVCICDTGSTDDTVNIIEKWCGEHKINYKVPVEKFVNFSYSRTFSYVLGKHYFPDTDYFLLLDADMILQVSPLFDSSVLNEPSYMIEQMSDTSRYWNTRLISNKYKWKCVGVTHEYWETTEKGIKNYEKLDTLVIDDREDGGAKADKYERDERLFKIEFSKGIQNKGLETRYLYYLGQTLECQHKWEEAILYFQKRADVKESFEEEGWYSVYKIGKCYMKWANEIAYRIKHPITDVQKTESIENIEEISYEDNFVGIPDDPDEMLTNPLSSKKETPTIVKVKKYINKPLAYDQETVNDKVALGLHHFLLAYQRRPTRAEPLYEVITYYREKGMNHLAVLFCETALEIPYPKGDMLFVDYKPYDYLLHIEMAINAYYVPDKKKKGNSSIRALLQMIINNEKIDKASAIHACKIAKFYPNVRDELNKACKILDITV